MRSAALFYLALAMVTGATLTLEVVCARVFSVVGWYHMSFLAISVAMLGMTAGAVYVYLRPSVFGDAHVSLRLVRYSVALSIAIPLSHLAIVMPGRRIQYAAESEFGRWLLFCIAAAVPFFLSGVVVALSLTRVRLPIGRVYAADLVGASAGCLAAVALLETTDPTSGLFVLGGMAAVGGVAYARWGGHRLRVPTLAAVALAAIGVANHVRYPDLLRIGFAKDAPIFKRLLHDEWNSHSRVYAEAFKRTGPAYWGPSGDAPRPERRTSYMVIDGEAGTVMTEFDGDLDSLGWTGYDVTALAYAIRGNGANVAVIGVGGGRDLLTALGHHCRHVTGIEINDIFLRLLSGKLREQARLADRPDVTLVHDDGRSWLTRTTDRFDIIQMSLIDTWAATSAGAMTLSENGLYTVDAWQMFLRRLRPGGVFTVSRWFSRDRLDETTRVVSLAVATLLAEGVRSPREHIFLAARGSIATLVLSRDPFRADDVRRALDHCDLRGFRQLLAPGRESAGGLIERIADARSPEALAAAVAHPLLDLSPPTDERPFFFNMIHASASADQLAEAVGIGQGVIKGNVAARRTLRLVLVVVGLLVATAIVAPLALFGARHGLGVTTFPAATAYFALIGLGFMLIQIGLMQRFTVLLGHPIYALAIVLCSMILFSGVGSLLSDRTNGGRGPAPWVVPLAVAILVGIATWAVAPVCAASMGWPLGARAAVVLAFVAPIGCALGMCFPIGMRLVEAHSSTAMPWMWGINGGFGVVGTIIAVMLSMTAGIRWSLLAGGACYLLLVPVALALRRPTPVPVPSFTGDAKRREAWVTPAAALALGFVVNMALWRLIPQVLLGGVEPHTVPQFVVIMTLYFLPSILLCEVAFRRQRLVLYAFLVELVAISRLELRL